MAHRFCTPDQIFAPAALSEALGPVLAVEREPLAAASHTAACFNGSM
jgi:hypothetical protein